jgi:hypothetical protein
VAGRLGRSLEGLGVYRWSGHVDSQGRRALQSASHNVALEQRLSGAEQSAVFVFYPQVKRPLPARSRALGVLKEFGDSRPEGPERGALTAARGLVAFCGLVASARPVHFSTAGSVVTVGYRPTGRVRDGRIGPPQRLSISRHIRFAPLRRGSRPISACQEGDGMRLITVAVRS